jgi:hypothetical protein
MASADFFRFAAWRLETVVIAREVFGVGIDEGTNKPVGRRD